MKRILIAGANSYIGTSFETYMKQFGDTYQIDTVDLMNGTWREKDFSGYDVVFHVAGIAHQKETKENAQLYYDINRDLAFAVAKKAKSDKVGQFIFLSSMSVYGMDIGIITKETIPNPKTNYGKSKLQAEQMMSDLSDSSFKIVILRPPMVYGEGCKGNYQSIVKIVKKLPVFPQVKNRRSMIHIDNLSSFIKKVIDGNYVGIYFPQDDKYVQTSEMAREIAQNLNRKIYFSRILGFAVTMLKPFSRTVRKAFGTLVYELEENGGAE